MDLTAGVDEAGRGPLAGPVVAAAVILDPLRSIPGIADSKQLTPKRREQLYTSICAESVAWAVGYADVEEIDRLNILQASLLAMQRAVQGLNPQPLLVLVDGNVCPKLSCPVQAVVGGDRLVTAISAASILAKVTRDRIMVTLDQQFPGYGFAVHKGYPTQAHLLNLQNLGVSTVHRRTFAPVRRIINKEPHPPTPLPLTGEGEINCYPTPIPLPLTGEGEQRPPSCQGGIEGGE